MKSCPLRSESSVLVKTLWCGQRLLCPYQLDFPPRWHSLTLAPTIQAAVVYCTCSVEPYSRAQPAASVVHLPSALAVLWQQVHNDVTVANNNTVAVFCNLTPALRACRPLAAGA